MSSRTSPASLPWWIWPPCVQRSRAWEETAIRSTRWSLLTWSSTTVCRCVSPLVYAVYVYRMHTVCSVVSVCSEASLLACLCNVCITHTHAHHPPTPQVDHYGSGDAVAKNLKREMERNSERFQFLKWGASAFKNFLIVPPGSGIVHQVSVCVCMCVGCVQCVHCVCECIFSTCALCTHP
jgi:hypothetical protein